MSLIVIVGQFDIHPEDANAAAQLMRTMMNESVKEQGCRHYAYSADLSEPNRFQLSETWDSAEALAAHLRTEHIAAFRSAMSKLRVEKRTVNRFAVTEAGSL